MQAVLRHYSCAFYLGFKVISSQPILYSFRAYLSFTINGLFYLLNSETLVITGIVWLVTVLVSKTEKKQIFTVGQWMLCFTLSALIYYGQRSL